MEDRLSRVEKKIDTLQEAIVSLARVEERLVTVFNRQSHIETKVDAMDEKVDRLSESVIKGKSAERIVWLVVAASIGAAVRYLA
jgi:vacuolar-type H+-ATPase subunit E/Vma4